MFYKIFLHQIAPFGLANWTKKVFPVFAVLRQNGCWKRQRVPFSVFRHCETFFLIFLWYFTTDWVFKNPKGSPLQFLWYFTTDWVFKNPEGFPFSVFGVVRLFFRKFVFSPKGPLNCDKNVDNFGSVPLLARLGLALAPLGPFFCFFDFRVL